MTLSASSPSLCNHGSFRTCTTKLSYDKVSLRTHVRLALSTCTNSLNRPQRAQPSVWFFMRFTFVKIRTGRPLARISACPNATSHLHQKPLGLRLVISLRPRCFSLASLPKTPLCRGGSSAQGPLSKYVPQPHHRPMTTQCRFIAHCAFQSLTERVRAATGADKQHVPAIDYVPGRVRGPFTI